MIDSSIQQLTSVESGGPTPVQLGLPPVAPTLPPLPRATPGRGAALADGPSSAPATDESGAGGPSHPGAPPLVSDPPQLPLARLYLTGDLRAAAGISRTHMDYYLREGLVRPMAKTEGGYLLFDERELQTLRWIIAARAAGLSIREIHHQLGR